LALVFTFDNFSIWSKGSFKIKYSEQLAVFVFLQNLSENSPENVFKTEFQKSKYYTENTKV
jgi:hypothetical protein